MKLRKALLLVLFTTTITVFLAFTPSKNLKEILENIQAISFEMKTPAEGYKAAYDMQFTQPIDHNNPDGEKFTQRVYLSHKGFDKPMVVILEGYTLFSTRPCELTQLLDANQLIIEHRFFKDSKPDSIPWQYLTVKQAAADQHKIIQTFKKYYSGKWVSTGISKGGQTTIFHRRYYPNDVDVSVPYVAPLNVSDEDKRVYEFLANVGDEKCRQKVKEFQEMMLQRKDEIYPIFDSIAEAKDWQFRLGRKKAYDLNVLEYSFAFWQWNARCDEIPGKESSPRELYDYWTSVAGFSFIEENSMEPTRPFFYQAMTEIGMYGYEIEPFKKYLDDTANIRFDFSMPKGVEYSYNPKPMNDISNWLADSGDYMLYIYGEYDAWSATAVEPSENNNAVIMFNPEGTHTTRIRSFPENMQDSIYHTLEKWLEIDLSSK